MKRALYFVLLFASACSRDAEIYEEPDAYVLPEGPNLEVEIPSVPGLDLEPELAECKARPEGCRGSNDFACAFTEYASATIDDCFRQSNCSADGWVSVTLDDNGCLTDIGMQFVDDGLIECLLGSLGVVRCPCSGSSFRLFLGADNDGCFDDPGPRG